MTFKLIIEERTESKTLREVEAREKILNNIFG